MAYKALGYSQITGIDAAAKALVQGSLGAIPAGADWCVIEAEGQAVRWRDDGTDPTASLGMVVASGAQFEYVGPMWRLRVIGAAAGAKVNVSFYKT